MFNIEWIVCIILEYFVLLWVLRIVMLAIAKWFYNARFSTQTQLNWCDCWYRVMLWLSSRYEEFNFDKLTSADRWFLNSPDLFSCRFIIPLLETKKTLPVPGLPKEKEKSFKIFQITSDRGEFDYHEWMWINRVFLNNEGVVIVLI